VTRERIAIAPEAPDGATRSAIVERARRRGFRRFVVPSGSPELAAEGEEVVVRDGDRLIVSGDGTPIPVERVGDLAGLERVLARTGGGSTVAIEWTGDRVIPLENAVARRGTRFRLWTFARAASEVPAALGALEHGADRVIVAVRTVAGVDELEGVVEGSLPTALDWTTVPARSVRPAGIGDRVLVDTTSLLGPEEGLLVGSAAAFLFLVTSEAVGSAFSRPRPFRVNAGAAHSYVLMADGSTRYLAELGPGDSLCVTSHGGRGRTVRVGRVKIERRPLALVSIDDGGRERTIFLQEAETVRLSTERGPVPVTDLVPSVPLHGVRLPPARHLGAAVEETVEER
jgi:3-dehydroquinate synthase II